ncbi:MAG: PaaI family thioesterase [Bacteroidales bacterium]
MSNPVLEFLRTMEGKYLEGSPSPVTAWLHGRLAEVSKGFAIMEYEVRKEMTNPLGTLQGGIFTTMMDDALGVAVYSLGKDKFYTSVNFHVDYLESAMVGHRIRVHARIMREGNTILNVLMEVKDESGKTLALGTSNLVGKEVEGFRLPRFGQMKSE